jgi:Cu/Ag efflux protein CusF
MHKTKLARTFPFIFALGLSATGVVIAAPAGQAAVISAAAMQVAKSGTFEKTISASAFKMTVGMKSYEVKTDAMTHVMADGKSAKLSALKKGDHVTVKGELEMGSIVATSVVAGM